MLALPLGQKPKTLARTIARLADADVVDGAESEPTKPQVFQGTYLQPKVYGKPESRSQWKRPNEGQRSSRP